MARIQFFNTSRKTYINFSISKLGFSIDCIRKLNRSQFVELLIQPLKRLIAVRPCGSGNKNSIKWIKRSGESFCPQYISGKAFLKTVYEIFGWNANFKYRICGCRKRLDNDFILLFNIADAETVIPGNENSDTDMKTKNNSVISFPLEWSNNFGNDFYSAVIENLNYNCGSVSVPTEKTLDFSEIHGLDITSREKAEKNIRQIINNIEEAVNNE